MNRIQLGVISIVMLVVLGWAAAAAGSEGARVLIKDDCDPATFNAAIGPGTCVGNGRTTFQSFIAQLQANGLVANRSAKGWKFVPGMFELDAGADIVARNKGGESHTFTEVQNFGGGCVAPLNAILHLTPVPECSTGAFAATLIPAGGTRDVTGLAPGLHHFECLIHPWMRTDVVVEQENENDDD
jgi:plastocyanin